MINITDEKTVISVKPLQFSQPMRNWSVTQSQYQYTCTWNAPGLFLFFLKVHTLIKKHHEDQKSETHYCTKWPRVSQEELES